MRCWRSSSRRWTSVAEVSPRVGLVLKADIRPGYDGQLTAKVERVERLLDPDVWESSWVRRTSSPVAAAGWASHRRAARARGAEVVVIDVRPPAEPIDGVTTVVGDASDAAVAGEAAVVAESRQPLAGWVNNAAVFDDVELTDAGALLRGGRGEPRTGGRRHGRCGSALRRPPAAGVDRECVVAPGPACRTGCLRLRTAKSAVEGLTGRPRSTPDPMASG